MSSTSTPVRLTTEQVVVHMVHGIPMTYSRYLDFRGWERQIGEEGDVPGYLVQRINEDDSDLLGPRSYLTWISESAFWAEQASHGFAKYIQD